MRRPRVAAYDGSLDRGGWLGELQRTGARVMTLEQERAALNAMLHELMKEHAGEFVLFDDAAPVGFYPDHATAYEAGLDRFGLDRPFLLAKIEPLSPQPVSLSWEAGVLFE